MASQFRMFGVTGEPLSGPPTNSSTGPSSFSPPALSSSVTKPSQAPTSKSHLPSWAQSLLSKPSISVRRGLAFSFDTPTEPSSVLVLTTKSSHYIDVRFSLTGTPPTSPSDPAFWAFAGLCDTTIPESALTAPENHPSGGGGDASVSFFPCTAHGEWYHPIDSNRAFEAIDEGDMFLLSNGDVMEVGVMENPKTGKPDMYKEYWTSPTPTPRTMSPCIVAKTLDPNTTDDRPGQGKGMIIRIGDFLQGIYQSDTEFFVERWKRAIEPNNNDDGEGAEDGTWIKDHRSNTSDEQVEVSIPCMWAAGERRKMGDRYEVNGKRWEIIECDFD